MIRWPEKYAPDKTKVHVHNELDMDVEPLQVWSWLIRAKLWPKWYKNSENVVIENGASDLSAGATFRWKTFGVHLESQVQEFEPPERLAWNGKGPGVDVYHAWLIQKTFNGCHVITEENQRGLVAWASNALMPTRMSKAHQMWLEQLLLKAKSGSP
jgi:Polyketide cyclase / dehydrase and lipid transport